MQTFPFKVGQTVKEDAFLCSSTTFLAIATSWENPTYQIILEKTDTSEFRVFWWDTTDGSIFNPTYYRTYEDAAIKYVEMAFNFSI